MEKVEASMDVVEARRRVRGSTGSFRKFAWNQWHLPQVANESSGIFHNLPWKRWNLPQAAKEAVEAPKIFHGRRGTYTLKQSIPLL